ncbi:ATP-binding cassette domain-containing protein [Thermoflexibacter ruber]|uniref:Molybdate transport system ATP-binding protein n=1 Tax=Thermoflexibacter ruber TaxID=1003 RepID=A0A1I2JVJ3_9BACT|nr:ATP-binding cassette domain-containing protein [Thermoflexibacter ruber]SFF58855.1 molybdate transport system ATP-binding protein [Thermoflexibacter ruber]
MKENTASKQVFLSLQNATFTKSNQLVIRNLNFHIHKGEQWAILGKIGAGKTTLLECLAGKYFLQEGGVNYFFDKEAIALVSFQEQSKLLDYSAFYYQQRYYASQTEGIITAQELLYQSLFQRIDKPQLDSIADLLQLREVLPLEVIKLSNGQKRKLLIAKALLKKPQLLLLDNPYIGLDISTRQVMNELINSLIDSGLQIVLVTNKEDIPQKITHIAEVSNFQVRVLSSLDLIKNYTPNSPPIAIPFIETNKGLDFETTVQFSKVNVSYGAKQILKNIDWTVKKGEKWAVLGNNGSGKSTLLSLIYADHPQSYANDIVLFDYPRGKGETIWDIKKMIGFVSPELHFYLQNTMTAFEIAATGLFDGFTLSRELTENEKHAILALFAYYRFTHLAQRNFLHLSTGEQRLILLIRALVKKPALLIMDEPFQNLDVEYINLSLNLLDTYLTSTDTLIYVTHYQEEIPKCIDNFLYLKDGEIAIK